VEQKKFRHDFYHRLNVVTIRVPSLTERREDIPALVEHYVQEFADQYGRRVQGFDSVSLKNLCEAQWPGNIRELRNTIERSVILADGPMLHWDSHFSEATDNLELPIHFSDDEFLPLEKLEQEYISHVLRCCNGKKTQAAKLLGIDKTTLWRKLRRYEDRAETV
jgi:DNA-binding NtrC family response regulator